MKCPLCQGDHELGQCVRWQMPIGFQGFRPSKTGKSPATSAESPSSTTDKKPPTEKHTAFTSAPDPSDTSSLTQCKAPGCAQTVHAKGYCNKHYQTEIRRPGQRRRHMVRSPIGHHLLEQICDGAPVKQTVEEYGLRGSLYRATDEHAEMNAAWELAKSAGAFKTLFHETKNNELWSLHCKAREVCLEVFTEWCGKK